MGEEGGKATSLLSLSLSGFVAFEEGSSDDKARPDKREEASLWMNRVHKGRADEIHYRERNRTSVFISRNVGAFARITIFKLGSKTTTKLELSNLFDLNCTSAIFSQAFLLLSLLCIFIIS